MRLFTAPDRADDRVEHVVHDHAPTRNVTERWVNLLAYVGERRPCARIGTRHAAIADRRKKHCNHGDQNHSCGMSMAALI